MMRRIGADVAMACWRSGLSVLPAIKSKKRPEVGRWREYMKRRPEEIEVDAWFANPHDAMCIVCGKVSGNLECIDFDAHGECLEAWKGKVDAALLDRLVIEQSPSGGYHVLYRSSEPVEGNLKLARGMREGKLTTLIETRGEGGVFLCSPTEGYELKQVTLRILRQSRRLNGKPSWTRHVRSTSRCAPWGSPPPPARTWANLTAFCCVRGTIFPHGAISGPI